MARNGPLISDDAIEGRKGSKDFNAVLKEVRIGVTGGGPCVAP